MRNDGLHWGRIVERNQDRTYKLQPSLTSHPYDSVPGCGRSSYSNGDRVPYVLLDGDPQRPQIIENRLRQRRLGPVPLVAGTGWSQTGHDASFAACCPGGGFTGDLDARVVHPSWIIQAAWYPLVDNQGQKLLIGNGVHNRDGGFLGTALGATGYGLVYGGKWYGGTWDSVRAVSMNAPFATLWTHADNPISGLSDAYMCFAYVVSQDGDSLIVGYVDSTTLHLKSLSTTNGAVNWTRSWQAEGSLRRGFENLVYCEAEGVVMVAYVKYGTRTTECPLEDLYNTWGEPAHQNEIPGASVWVKAFRVSDGQDAWHVNATPDRDCVFSNTSDLGRILVSGSSLAFVYRSLDLPNETIVWSRRDSEHVWVLVDGAWVQWDASNHPYPSGTWHGHGPDTWSLVYRYRQRLVTVHCGEGAVNSSTILDSAVRNVYMSEYSYGHDGVSDFLYTDRTYACRCADGQAVYATRDGYPLSGNVSYQEATAVFVEDFLSPPHTSPGGWRTVTVPATSLPSEMVAVNLDGGGIRWKQTLTSPTPATHHYSWRMLSCGNHGYVVRSLKDSWDTYGDGGTAVLAYFSPQEGPAQWKSLGTVVRDIRGGDLITIKDRLFIVTPGTDPSSSDLHIVV